LENSLIVGIIKNNSSRESDVSKEVISFFRHKYQASNIYEIETSNRLILMQEALSEINILRSPQSYVIGEIYSSKNYTRVSAEEYARSRIDSCHCFIKEYWGTYWFIKQEEDSGLSILLDPLGQFPFFYILLPDQSILFSSSLDFLHSWLNGCVSLNWRYLCSFLFHGNLITNQTAFLEIHSLPPGCELKISQGQVQLSPIWNPLEHILDDAAEPSDIVDILMKTLSAPLQTAKGIFLDFSGGVDSTSILFCLKKLLSPSQSITPMHFYDSHVRSSEEFDYALQSAKEAGVDLELIDISSFPYYSTPSQSYHRANWPSATLLLTLKVMCVL
jgi:asparagine synthase (glutamine-hydrolysing)